MKNSIKSYCRLQDKAKCMTFISGYDNELYQKALTKKKGWKSKKIKASTRDSSGKIHKRTEVLWMNKYFIKAQKAKRVPIKLTEKDECLINSIRLEGQFPCHEGDSPEDNG